MSVVVQLPSQTRKTNQAGIDLIKHFEGLRAEAYVCPAGKWTIGYGHTGPEVTPYSRVSIELAEEILLSDLVKFERAVSQAVNVALTDNQFAALVAFTYNVGIAALKASTLLKKLNTGDYGSVPAELAKWVRGGGVVLPGLIKRRAAEAALFIKQENVA